jgi:clan AA aspartic protease
MLKPVDDGKMASMGLTHVRASVTNPARPRRSARIEFLVDSGALYSVVPGHILRNLGIRPHSERTFMLADGTEITRAIGDASFHFDDHRGASPVIFGQGDDAALLGAVSLESLGLMLDPMKRVLRQLPMVLG